MHVSITLMLQSDLVELTVLLGNKSFSTQVKPRGDDMSFLSSNFSVVSVKLIQCESSNL